MCVCVCVCVCVRARACIQKMCSKTRRPPAMPDDDQRRGADRAAAERTAPRRAGGPAHHSVMVPFMAHEKSRAPPGASSAVARDECLERISAWMRA